MTTVLELDNIQKAYGQTKGLNGVSFAIPEGSIFGILGPNGSGKTTLLGIILDVLKADAGSFRWFGSAAVAAQRQRIGALLETPNFYYYLSGARNLEITRQISRRGAPGDIDTVLKDMGLYERRKSRFSTYSLGMKQRLAIGAALLGSPAVLVLDEPTNGLDPAGIAEIRELIIKLRAKGHTIIIASHLLDEVEKVCTHVAILKNGHLLTTGAVEDVLAEEDIVEVGAAEMGVLADALKQWPGVLYQRTENGRIVFGVPKDSADLAAINSFCFQRGIILNHLYFRKKRLETRFIELTQN